MPDPMANNRIALSPTDGVIGVSPGVLWVAAPLGMIERGPVCIGHNIEEEQP